MPMKLIAKCPHCGLTVDGDLTKIENRFGFRTMANGKKIFQSYCRVCRAKNKRVK